MTTTAIRKSITPKAKKELTSLVLELNTALKELKTAEETASYLKARIKEIVNQYDLPNDEGKSQSLDIPDSDIQLTIVRPERSMTIDPEKFLDQVGCDIFHKVCDIKKVSLDMNIWDLLKLEERVYDSQLLNSIAEDDLEKEQTVTIRISKKK